MKKSVLVLTCEHAGNQIPETYLELFEGAAEDLNSHLGWDPGAIDITTYLAEFFTTDYHSMMISRLLIEVNRSIDHPQLFSRYTTPLSPDVKQVLIQTYYEPYRTQVSRKIQQLIDEGKVVVHLSIHTFTPVWEGHIREVEIGLLFDENRSAELEFCENWKRVLDSGPYTIRLNEPYKGADDGFTTHLRTIFTNDQYLGLELEVSQQLVRSKGFPMLNQRLAESLRAAL